MSDTPRTDACEVRFTTLFAGEDAMWVPSKKAKEIERELNAAQADAESWQEQSERFGQQLIEAHDTVTRMRLAISHSQNEICQTAGMALGYPWFKDDLKNFPDATEHDGVCVGEHVAETIVAELASRYAEANERIKQLELELEKAWRMHHKAAGEI